MSTLTQTLNAWQCHPKAEAIILDLLAKSCERNSVIAQLQKELQEQTSTRLFDWLDHVAVGNSKELQKNLTESGFTLETPSPSKSNYQIFHHPGAQLPRVVMHNKTSEVIEIAVTVDSIADFLMVHHYSSTIEGTLFGHYRRSQVSNENQAILWVVERRCSSTMEPTYFDSVYVESYLKATELWMRRPRNLDDEDKAMEHAIIIANKMIQLIGQDLAAWVVMEVERKYWQAKNTAAQFQKNRQDHLGMGWANHDHHTFRSSRRHFSQLITLFESLGFYCRERFYAGKEAGWGAQIMEHAHTRLVLFLDVDLEPDEIAIDFRTRKLPPLKKLSTVGLWCALHGDSILKAGMHHLEAQFLFEELTQDLATKGINMMNPFSNFPYLRQAFTKGENWKVDEKRIHYLLKAGLITQEQADRFSSQGAIGSHLENLQRREGYKGFNQNNVSYIIQKTDPRNLE